MTPKTAVFPGSFDPFTKGHEEIVNKALGIFDRIVIAIGVNTQKKYLFDLGKRIAHIETLFEGNERIQVQEFSTLTVEHCKKVGAEFILRGLRNTQDFEYEKSIAHMNYDLAGIETVFFLTELKHSAISSTIVREIHKNNGPIDRFVTKSDLLV